MVCSLILDFNRKDAKSILIARISVKAQNNESKR